MSFPVPLQPPEDGFERFEKIFLRQMVIDIYRFIPNARDKFILMAIHDLGYSIGTVAEILEIPQLKVSTRLHWVIKKIRKNKNFKKNSQ